MASLKKRKDGRYAKQITIGIKDGKPVKKTVYGKTIKEVEAKYTELVNLINNGVKLDLKNVTVSDLVDEWYQRRIFPNVNPNTQKRYYYFIKSLKENLGNMKITDVKRYHIEVMLDNIKQNGNASAHDKLQLTKKFFDFAVESDIIIKNPCIGISLKYAPKVKRLLTKEELSKIDNCDLTLRDKALLYTFRYTGMRCGEVFALTKDDIDKENMLIHVNKTIVSAQGPTIVQEKTKTSAGNRTIPIFLPLAKVLFNYIDRLDNTNYLFLNNVGGLHSITSGNHLLKRILRNCEIYDSEITPHYFRHNFISECYEAGIDVKKVQLWVGHTDIKTTLDIYTHLSESKLNDGSGMDDYYGSQTEVKENDSIIKQPIKRVL